MKCPICDDTGYRDAFGFLACYCTCEKGQAEKKRVDEEIEKIVEKKK